uniref:Uncharacterized protein ORF-c08_026 n=1 Tax=Saccharolobus solfataricus TaxID=2287 RepID=Q9UX17_SACSO|nr:hypothetical protein [Saccharolobus solfataricus P2]
MIFLNSSEGFIVPFVSTTILCPILLSSLASGNMFWSKGSPPVIVVVLIFLSSFAIISSILISVPISHEYFVSHHTHLKLHVASLMKFEGIPITSPSPWIEVKISITRYFICTTTFYQVKKFLF